MKFLDSTDAVSLRHYSDCRLSFSATPLRATVFNNVNVSLYCVGWSGTRFCVIDSKNNVTLWGEESYGSLGSYQLNENDRWKEIPDIPKSSMKVQAIPGNLSKRLDGVSIVMVGFWEMLLDWI